MKHMHEKEESEYIALSLIADSDEPVGNHRLLQALISANIDVAEATAGRILRDLVNKGYAETLKRRGRILTKLGADRLAQLRARRGVRERTEQLIKAINVSDVQAMLDLLYVRRAVEPEAARLAALRATEDDLRHMDISACAHCQAVGAKRQRKASDRYSARVEPAIDFHRQLIIASHNDVLVAIGSILLEERNGQSLYVLDRISLDPDVARLAASETDREAKSLADEHGRILRCIRSRDPEGAAVEMRQHIDRLISHAERYMEQMGRQPNPG